MASRRGKYDECIGIAHWWEEFQPGQRTRATAGRTYFRCVRPGGCGGVRSENVRADGSVWGRHYEMPDDYSEARRLADGSRMTKRQVRRRLVRSKPASSSRGAHLRAVG